MQKRRKEIRRQAERIHLVYHLLVFDRVIGQLIGNLVDISTTGMRVMTEAPIELNTRYECRMVLPAGLEEGSRQLDFDAQTVWCRGNLYSDFCGVGFKVSKIGMEHVEVIGKLIDDFGRQQ